MVSSAPVTRLSVLIIGCAPELEVYVLVSAPVEAGQFGSSSNWYVNCEPSSTAPEDGSTSTDTGYVSAL
jgi:hypothetical protein